MVDCWCGIPHEYTDFDQDGQPYDTRDLEDEMEDIVVANNDSLLESSLSSEEISRAEHIHSESGRCLKKRVGPPCDAS